MLVLSRGPSEKIVFPNLGITLEVLRVKGNRVQVGIDAPPHVPVMRHELVGTGNCPAPPATDSQQLSLSHRQRNRLHTAQLALCVLQRQLQDGLSPDAAEMLQTALREFDALDAELFAEKGEPPLPEPGTGRRALLVEDNVNECELLSAYLRMSGYSVDAADDGLKALVYLSRHCPPDVVLLDMHMPELNGPETIRSIRNNPELRGVKIFAVTGCSQAEIGVTVGPEGVDRWFRKPINPKDLVAEMQRELEVACVRA